MLPLLLLTGNNTSNDSWLLVRSLQVEGKRRCDCYRSINRINCLINRFSLGMCNLLKSVIFMGKLSPLNWIQTATALISSHSKYCERKSFKEIMREKKEKVSCTVWGLKGRERIEFYDEWIKVMALSIKHDNRNSFGVWIMARMIPRLFLFSPFASSQRISKRSKRKRINSARLKLWVWREWLLETSRKMKENLS